MTFFICNYRWGGCFVLKSWILNIILEKFNSYHPYQVEIQLLGTWNIFVIFCGRIYLHVFVSCLIISIFIWYYLFHSICKAILVIFFLLYVIYLFFFLSFNLSNWITFILHGSIILNYYKSLNSHKFD